MNERASIPCVPKRRARCGESSWRLPSLALSFLTAGDVPTLIPCIIHTEQNFTNRKACAIPLAMTGVHSLGTAG